MRPAPLDLIEQLPGAEQRTYGRDPQAVVHVEFVRSGSEAAPAIVIEAPARLIYKVRMPAEARFEANVAFLSSPPDSAGGVTLRLGLSDQRHYDQVLNLPLTSDAKEWRAIRVDLAEFSGRQWSVFYRPAAIVWDLILNVDARPGGTVAWARPRITM
jgi:hypothetical protein